MRHLTLSTGELSIVDDDDYSVLSKNKWMAKMGRSKPYVTRMGWDASTKKNIRLYLHRVIMRAPKGFEVDHINGDALDNRKENLRLCTSTQNKQNATLRKNKLFDLPKGIRFRADSPRRPYQALITVNGKQMSLGRFASPSEASDMYMKNALKYFGEFANSGVANSDKLQ